MRWESMQDAGKGEEERRGCTEGHALFRDGHERAAREQLVAETVEGPALARVGGVAVVPACAGGSEAGVGDPALGVAQDARDLGGELGREGDVTDGGLLEGLVALEEGRERAEGCARGGGGWGRGGVEGGEEVVVEEPGECLCKG